MFSPFAKLHVQSSDLFDLLLTFDLVIIYADHDIMHCWL